MHSERHNRITGVNDLHIDETATPPLFLLSGRVGLDVSGFSAISLTGLDMTLASTSRLVRLSQPLYSTKTADAIVFPLVSITHSDDERVGALMTAFPAQDSVAVSFAGAVLRSHL